MHYPRAVLLAVALLISRGGLAMAEESSAMKEPQEIEIRKFDDSRQKLLKERYNTAVQEYLAAGEHYRNGTGSIDLIFSASQHLRESKLALVLTQPERVSAYEELLQLAKMVEDSARQRLEGGAGTKLDWLRAKYERMNAQLLREDAPKTRIK
jgi:hypothetical protein